MYESEFVYNCNNWQQVNVIELTRANDKLRKKVETIMKSKNFENKTLDEKLYQLRDIYGGELKLNLDVFRRYLENNLLPIYKKNIDGGLQNHIYNCVRSYIHQYNFEEDLNVLQEWFIKNMVLKSLMFLI